MLMSIAKVNERWGCASCMKTHSNVIESALMILCCCKTGWIYGRRGWKIPAKFHNECIPSSLSFILLTRFMLDLKFVSRVLSKASEAKSITETTTSTVNSNWWKYEPSSSHHKFIVSSFIAYTWISIVRLLVTTMHNGIEEGERMHDNKRRRLS